MRFAARLAAVAASLVAVLAAAPPAGAAAASIGLEVEPMPFLRPGQEASFAANLTYSYDEPAANATTITLLASAAPAWLTARADPPALQVDASDPSGRTVVPLRIILGVAPDAPALEQHSVQFRLEASANPPVERAENTAGVVVRVAYVGRLEVAATQERYEGRPGEPAAVGVRIRNEGNGPARVTLEAVDPGRGVAVLPPGPVLVEARGALRERVLNVSVLAPQPGEFPIALRYSSTHAFDPTLPGDSGQVMATLVVGSSGIPAAPLVATVFAAALGTALLPRRRG